MIVSAGSLPRHKLKNREQYLIQGSPKAYPGSST